MSKHISQSQMHYLSLQLEKHMMSYGFQTIDLPVIDESDLFLTRAGDQAIEKLFTFERFGRQWALRPEFTASAALKYADEFSPHNERSQIVRWQFHSPIFINHSNQDQATREYQSYSIGAELIGASGSFADAEIIAMAIKGIETQGISNTKIKLGHVGLLRIALKQFKLDDRTERFILNNRQILKTQSKNEMWQLLDAYIGTSDTALHNIDGEFLNHSSEQSAFEMFSTLAISGSRSQTMGGRTYEDIANRIIRKRKQASQISQIERTIDFITQWINLADDVAPAFAILDEMIVDEELQSVLDNWRHTVDLLQALDIPLEHITIQPDLARDWNYYTGIVFEITDSNDSTLAGGGRYDELVSLVSNGHAVPAIGFAYYADNIVGLGTNQQNHLPMINIVGENKLQVLRWANALRSYDLAVTIIPNELGENLLIITSENEAKWSENKYSFENIHTLVEKIKQNAGQ